MLFTDLHPHLLIMTKSFFLSLVNCTIQSLSLMGDLNFPTINWDELSCSGWESTETSSFRCCSGYFLNQHVTDFTLYRHATAIVFRLSFHFWTQCYKCCYSFISFGKQWPCLSFWNLKYFDKLPPTGLEVPLYNNYRKGNYDRMNEYFNNIQWSEVLSSSSIQDKL